jgi:AI-2 transport protein TqsA
MSAREASDPFFLRVGPVFLAVCAAVYACRVGGPILIPLVVAFFLWYLINAIVRFLGTLKFSGARIPRFLRFCLAIAFLWGIAYFVYVLVSGNIADLKEAAPVYQSRFGKILNGFAGMLHLENLPQLEALVNDARSHIDIPALIRLFIGFLTGMAQSTLVVLVYVGFLLYEQRYFDRKFALMIKDKDAQRRVRGVLSTIDNKIQRYIGVKAFVSFVDSTLTFIILTSFGVDFAAFWGLMAFFLHFIPYAGSFVAITMPFLIALIQYAPDISHGLLVMAVLCMSHALLGHVLDPFLMGENLNLSPIFIISNLVIWGMIWGVPGMFLAIPILAIMVIAMAQFEATRPLAVLLSKTGVLDKNVSGKA